MTRDEFYAKAAALDEAALRKALWTLYWRGGGPVRERIEAQLDPQQAAAKRTQDQLPPAPEEVQREVREFVDLARSGAYLGRDRRVSPTERSRWRMTFRRLAKDAQAALRHDDVDTAAGAVELLVDLACETRDYDLFRSEDPMQAAGFVVSDAVGLLWTRLRDQHGFAGLAERAVPQLLRWEAPFGWTRFGFGSVAEKESTLTTVLRRMLSIPDHWETFAAAYLAALDDAIEGDVVGSKSGWRSVRDRRRDRADSMAEWHQLLLDRLLGSEAHGLVEQLVVHESLDGPERTYLEAQLELHEGRQKRALELFGRCLRERPGDRRFIEAPQLLSPR